MAQELTKIGGEVAVANGAKDFWYYVRCWLGQDKKHPADKEISPKTQKVYLENIRIFKAWLDANCITIPGKPDIARWFDEMRNTVSPKTRRPLSINTLNLRLTCVRVFYKYLESEFDIVNVATKRNLKVTREHKRDILGAAQMKQLVASIVPDNMTKAGKTLNKYQRRIRELQAARDKAIIATMLIGALRTVEVSRLTVEDLYIEGGVWFLNVLGKGRADKEKVKISAEAAESINQWLDLRAGFMTYGNADALFCALDTRHRGECLSSASVSRIVKNWLVAAGLRAPYKKGQPVKQSRLVAHSLRHSCATAALANGAPITAISEHLRHAHIDTSMIYAHLVNKFANPCADIISNLLS